MISIVENSLKLLSRSARRNTNLLRLSSSFSTHKSQEEFQQPNQQTKPPNTQQVKPINKNQLFDKFNTFSKKIEFLNKQIEERKDFNEISERYKKLNNELMEGRNKITELIEGGKKQWDDSKERIAGIEDKNLIDFGKQLIKFNHKLKELSSFKVKQQQSVLAEGIGMTSRILNNTLLKYNFKQYEPLKEKYDPKKHQKVGQGEVKKDATITKIVEPGWIYKTTVIEPSKVEL